MRRIDLNDSRGPSRITALICGDSRAGKTWLGASFPRPIVLADATETGWTTMQHMPDEAFYEVGRLPEVIAIENTQDFIEAVMHVEDVARDPKRRDEYGTVLIDSLTFYAELFFAEREFEQAQRNKVDTRQIYGELYSHLRHMMIRIHKLPYNVVWTALPKEGGEDGALGGISVPGQMATKAPARCDMWLYMQQARKGNNLTYVTHTQNYGGFKAGHRFGDMLPPKIENLSYKKIEELLDLMPWTERFGGKKSKGGAPRRPASKSAARA